MKPRSRWTLPVVASVALATVVAGAAWWQSAAAEAALVDEARPALPDLGAATPTLRAAIERADARARSPWHARRGLAELARLYHANGFLAAALQSEAALERLEPANPRWPHRRATLLAGYGQAEEAAALWRRVLELAPDYLPARLRLADLALKTNQPAAAAALYQEVLRRSPDEPYALLGLARLDVEAERWDEARRRLETVVAQTKAALGYDLIVPVYEKLGMVERARAIRASAKASGAYRDPPDPWVDELLAECHDPYRLALAAGTRSFAGDAAGAEPLLRRAIEVAPDDVSARFQLGVLALGQGNLPVAREQLERCTQLAPGFADGWARLSETLTRQGAPAAADRILAEGLRQNLQSPGLHLLLARRHRESGRVGEAIIAYQTSSRLRPNEPDAYLELGAFLIQQGREAEALQNYRQALSAEPGNPVALAILAFQAITTGDAAEARRWLAQVRQQPRVPPAQVEHLRSAFREKFGVAPE